MRATFSSYASLTEIPSKAQQCRRNARHCAMLAASADDPQSRNRLLAMQSAWLGLAANEDWLEGERQPETIAILPLGR